MTERIKSTIEHLDNLIGMVEDNQNTDYNSVFKLAIRSLKAWEEVLWELKNMRDIIWQDTDDDVRIVRANAWDKIEILSKATDIINQHLAEIDEREENETNKIYLRIIGEENE